MLATRMSHHIWNKKKELLGSKLCAEAATQPAQYLLVVSPHHREQEKGVMAERERRAYTPSTGISSPLPSPAKAAGEV